MDNLECKPKYLECSEVLFKNSLKSFEYMVTNYLLQLQEFQVMSYSRRKETQQLIIPRGAIGADEIAVIEIPKRFQRLPVVVAKRKATGSRGPDAFINLSTDPAQNYYRPRDQQANARYYGGPVQIQPNQVYAQKPQPGVYVMPAQGNAPNMANQIPIMPNQVPAPSAPPLEAYEPPKVQGVPICPSALPPTASCQMYACPSEKANQGPSNLRVMEEKENEILLNSLEEFQKARRKFYAQTNNLAGQGGCKYANYN